MSQEREADRRRRENADLVARMRRGESLTRVSSSDTWWPPRPIIKKDEKAMARVYGEPERGQAPLKEV